MRWRQNGAGASISGQDAIRALRRSSPGLGIVAHGERPERHIASAAMQAGASAYVARTAGTAELRRAVAAAAAQESYVDPAVPPKGSRGKLTRRQREILQLLADGESTTVAARELDLSEETVKTHIKTALARLGARNRTHAVGDRPARVPDRLAPGLDGALDPAAVAGGEHRLGAVDGADLAVDVVEVGADGRDRELHLAGDLLVDHALGEVAEDVELTGRERAGLADPGGVLARPAAARREGRAEPSGPRPQRSALARSRSGEIASPWE